MSAEREHLVDPLPIGEILRDLFLPGNGGTGVKNDGPQGRLGQWDLFDKMFPTEGEEQPTQPT